MSKLQLCLHHELMLLVLDDSKGSFAGAMYTYGLAGAIMSELLLQGIVKVSNDDKQIVSVAINSSTDDPILDDVIKLIDDSSKPKAMKHWVCKLGATSGLNHKIAQQLCELGILNFDESKVLWLFTRKRYPELDGSYEDAIRARMAEVMFNHELKPDERTAVLIALGKSSGALDANFAKVELRQHDARIKEICEGKVLASGATVEAIAAVHASMMAATMASTIAITAATSAG